MTYKVNTKLTFDQEGNIKPSMGQFLLLSGIVFGLSTVLYLLAQLVS